MAGSTAAAKPLGTDPLQGIGVGEDAGDRLEPRRLHVDELARDPLADAPSGGRRSPPGTGRSARS